MARAAESASLAAEADRLREEVSEGHRALSAAAEERAALEEQAEELRSRVASMTPIIANARLDGQVGGAWV
jgi:predicted  nucleic acid-binding Zn-ribbon protein